MLIATCARSVPHTAYTLCLDIAQEARRLIALYSRVNLRHFASDSYLDPNTVFFDTELRKRGRLQAFLVTQVVAGIAQLSTGHAVANA
eukprot:3941219-Rhodomonas_salina.1